MPEAEPLGARFKAGAPLFDDWIACAAAFPLKKWVAAWLYPPQEWATLHWVSSVAEPADARRRTPCDRSHQMRVLPLILAGLVCAGCSPGAPDGQPAAASSVNNLGRAAVVQANAGKLTEAYCLGVTSALVAIIAQAVGPESEAFKDAITYGERLEARLLSAKGFQSLEDLETADPALSGEITRGTRGTFAQIASTAGVVTLLTGPEREKLAANLKAGAPPFDSWAQCKKSYPAGG